MISIKSPWQRQRVQPICKTFAKHLQNISSELKIQESAEIFTYRVSKNIQAKFRVFSRFVL
jgi:hypothetical protein